MSLLWPDQLRIALSPTRVTAVRVAGFPRRTVATKESLVCEPGTPSWRGALDALSRVLPRMAGQGAEASVVLSNEFARYQILPWSDAISSEEELQAYARHSFAQVHGEAARQWSFSIDILHRGAPMLACAVDRALLDGLEQAFANSSSRLMSVQPHLVTAYNAQRGNFAAGEVWFALVEERRMLLALLRDGAWQSVAVRRLSGTAPDEELQLLLEREWRLKGLPESARQVYVYGPELRQAPALAGSWKLQWLRPQSAFGLSLQNEAAFAMALT